MECRQGLVHYEEQLFVFTGNCILRFCLIQTQCEEHSISELVESVPLEAIGPWGISWSPMTIYCVMQFEYYHKSVLK